ncbi:MAG: flagellar motor protein MotB [Pikeienuella sp.]
MSNSSEARPIIVKKVSKSGGDGHHGGAWKVAYADFVTAMMAFFLLMWLLNATTEKQRKGIADYFDPSIPLARISAGGAHMLSGDSVMTTEDRAGSDEPRPARQSAEEPPKALARPGEEARAPAADDPAADDAWRAEQRRLEALADSLRGAVSDAGDGLDRHFKIFVTPEGLILEIVDTGDEPLFDRGSAAPSENLRRLVEVVVPVLNLATNKIAVIGHTDASPFPTDPYGNWELSAARAIAAQRLIRAAGMDEARFARVSGRAATTPLSANDLAPENRRISVKLLRGAPR